MDATDHNYDAIDHNRLAMKHKPVSVKHNAPDLQSKMDVTRAGESSKAGVDAAGDAKNLLFDAISTVFHYKIFATDPMEGGLRI